MQQSAQAGAPTASSAASAEHSTQGRRWLPRKKRRRPWSSEIDKKFSQYADFFDEAITRANRRYRRMSLWHMVWYRSFGTIEVLLSVTLPFILLLGSEGATLPQALSTNFYLIVSALSVAIALTAAVRAFWGWNDNWRLYRMQGIALSTIIRRWELQMFLALASPDEKDGTARAYRATSDAMESLFLLFEHEQENFFGAIRLPSDIAPRTGRAAA